MSSTPQFSRVRTSLSSLQPYACLTAILAAILALSAQSSAAVTFTASAITSGDSLSKSIVSGDFNNDGILDLVTANYSTVSFYKGLGGGKYAAPVNFTLNNVTIEQSAAADFNRDGKLDLAVANGGGSVVILLGNGNGTFTQGVNIPLSGPAGSLTLADFNGDHIPDIAVNSCPPPGGGCGLSVLLGLGNGTFQQSAALSNGGASLVAGDFNADGRQDIAVAASSKVLVYLGEGNGQFQSPLSISQLYAVDLAVGDFYSNRIQSLAVVNIVVNSDGTESPYVDTVRYSGGKLVATTPQFVTKQNFFPTLNIAAGDLNGDFKDDIVLAGEYSTPQSSQTQPFTAYMLGNGNGTFAAKVVAPSHGYYEFSPFVRDLNGDSRHDVGIDWSVNYPNGGGAFVLLNTSAATNCGLPKANKLSVHICAPTSGETVSSTFTFQAAGNAFNGIAKRMELWIDGRKVGQNLEDQLRLTTTLTAGSHKATFVVVDSFDQRASQSVTFTAQ